MTKLKLARLEGQSTDGKPLKYAGGDTPVGAEYTNLDDGRRYKFDGLKWNELTRTDEGKNWASKQPRSSLIQLFGDEFAQIEASVVFTLEDLTDSSPAGGNGLINNGEVDFNRIEDQLPLRGYKVPSLTPSSQWFEIPHESKVDVASNSFIARIDFKHTGTVQTLFGYGSEEVSHANWSAFINSSGFLRIEIDDGTNASGISDTDGNWSDDKWHTLVMFVDRTNDNIYMIVDGQLAATTTAATVTGSLTQSDEDLNIGTRRLSGGSKGNTFDGELSNFQLYIDADPNKLFNLIPILSNPQLRESAFNDGGSGSFALLANSNHRLNNDVSAGTGQGQYITTVINTSEGWYDIIELHRTNSNHGIRKLLIDGVEVVPEEDWYSASLTHNIKTENKGIYLSAGSHILKYLSDTKNASSTAYMIRWYMIELIKRDGEYQESDEAISGILFGDELLEKETMGAGSLAIDTGTAYNSEYTDFGVVAGEFLEGTIFVKKGLYRITYTADTLTTFSTFSLIMGGVKVLDNTTAFDIAVEANHQETRFAFLEGGKTSVKILIDSTATGDDFKLSNIRFELVDGKGNGGVVNILGADPFETVSGATSTISASTTARFNHNLSIPIGSDALNDEDLHRAYFSGGTYLFQHLYGINLEGGTTDIFLDGDSASPFIDNLNQQGSANPNQSVYTILNIPRGFHDVHIKNVADGGTNKFGKQFQLMKFTKIGENPDEADDNSDGVHGSIVPLARHKARTTESSIAFDLSHVNTSRFSKLNIVWALETSASLQLELKINTIATGYYVDGVDNIAGTTANLDDSNTAQWIIADSSTGILDIANREASGTIDILVTNQGNHNWINGISEAMGATRGSEMRGLTLNAGVVDIDTITIETSTSTWREDAEFFVYGVLR